MQFKQLKSIEVSAQSTARCTFYDIEGEPWIEVRPAGEVNRDYFNAVLKRNTTGSRRRLAQTGRLNGAALQQIRDDDRELFPVHVLTGQWGGWIGENGEVSFSVEAAVDLLRQLPADQMDKLRNFAADLSNFRTDHVDQSDAAATAKN